MTYAVDKIDLTLTVLHSREQRLKEMGDTLNDMLRRYEALVSEQSEDLRRVQRWMEDERERMGGDV